MSKKPENAAETKAKQNPDPIETQPLAKTSINKYDPYQLKASIDDEIVTVSIPSDYSIFATFNFLLSTCLSKCGIAFGGQALQIKQYLH